MSGPEGSSIKKYHLCVVVFLYHRGRKMNEDIYFMKCAIDMAYKAQEKDEVPIGAVIVYQGQIIAQAFNEKEESQSATRHAEIIAIERASQLLQTWYLDECTLYVTLEPCMMCTGAIVNSRLKRVVYGASEKRWIALSSLMDRIQMKEINHQVVYQGGILEEECANLLSQYFKDKREKKKLLK